MSDEQIEAAYRQSRYKIKEIRILAQLNDCPESCIRAILERRRGRRDTSDEDTGRIVPLRRKGLTYREIARETGLSTGKIRYLLTKKEKTQWTKPK